MEDVAAVDDDVQRAKELVESGSLESLIQELMGGADQGGQQEEAPEETDSGDGN